jgi:hypothetical protein
MTPIEAQRVSLSVKTTSLSSWHHFTYTSLSISQTVSSLFFFVSTSHRSIFCEFPFHVENVLNSFLIEQEMCFCQSFRENSRELFPWESVVHLKEMRWLLVRNRENSCEHKASLSLSNKHLHSWSNLLDLHPNWLSFWENFKEDIFTATTKNQSLSKGCCSILLTPFRFLFLDSDVTQSCPFFLKDVVDLFKMPFFILHSLSPFPPT